MLNTACRGAALSAGSRAVVHLRSMWHTLRHQHQPRIHAPPLCEAAAYVQESWCRSGGAHSLSAIAADVAVCVDGATPNNLGVSLRRLHA